MEEIIEGLALAYTGMSEEDIAAEIAESPFAEQVEDPMQLAQYIVSICG